MSGSYTGEFSFISNFFSPIFKEVDVASVMSDCLRPRDWGWLDLPLPQTLLLKKISNGRIRQKLSVRTRPSVN